MAARKPPAFISSIVVYNSRNEQGDFVGLTLNIGGAYEVSLGRGRTAFVKVLGLKSLNCPSVHIMWLYTKTDVIQCVDRETQRQTRSAIPNALFLSNHNAVISRDSFIRSIVLVHTTFAFGMYGQLLRPTQLKEEDLYVYDKTINTTTQPATVTNTPYTRFNTVEAGDAYPQPSTMSVEQFRTKLGQLLFRTKASTGGHRVSGVLDVDFSIIADLLNAITHTCCNATVRVVDPSLEDLSVLCSPEYLRKISEGMDTIRCTVIYSSVRIVYYFSTFRLGVSFQYTREILDRGGTWRFMDNAQLLGAPVEEGVITVALNGVVVTSQFEGGGLPVDTLTTLGDVRMLLSLHNLATLEETEELHFHIDGGMVSNAYFLFGSVELFKKS